MFHVQTILDDILYAGSDIGYGASKNHLLDSNNYNSKFIITSTVAPGRDRTLAVDSSGGKDPYDPKLSALENQLKYLDVEIQNLDTGEKQWWFLGRLAIKAGGNNTTYCWDDDKSRDKKSMALLIALLAAGQTDRVKGIDSYTKIYVVTGLPIKLYRDLKSSYEHNIKGRWQVTFKGGIWKGISATLDIRGCRAFPQALGIFNDQVVDLEGNVRNMELFNDYVLVLDPGARTTDWAMFKDGIIVDELADSLELGMSTVLEKVTDALKEFDKKLTVVRDYDLDLCFIENDGIYKKGTEEYELNEIKNDALYKIADSLNQQLKKTLGGTYDLISNTLVGGGTGKELYPYIKFPNKRLAEDASFGNASGFVKYAIEIANETAKKGGLS